MGGWGNTSRALALASAHNLFAVSAPSLLTPDVLLFGGGIAGLWTLDRLRQAGFDALLIERGRLGEGQTVGSQGIIHGGIKYALTGQASAASRAIADMPRRWLECLSGTGEVDLSRATVLAEHQHLWTTPGLLSRVAAAGASRVIRTAVESLARDERPPAFAAAPRGVDVYQVAEPVLDARSVLEALAGANRGRVLAAPDAGPGAEGAVTIGEHRIEPRAIVLCAGAGNPGLLRDLGAETPVRTQVRPLHMVMARFAGGAEDASRMLFGHCLGASSLPRLTVTTACDGSNAVWYIGGTIAEQGVGRSPEEQIDAARAELRACLPWADLAGVGFATCRWDRAEALLPGSPEGQRPDEPVVVHVEAAGSGNTAPILAAWPTKLALAPAMADQVLARLASLNIHPSGRESRHPSPLLNGRIPELAPHPWAAEGVVWT